MAARTAAGIVILVTTSLFCESAAAVPNRIIELERGWRFDLHDGLEPGMPGFDDSAWSTVHVPHNGHEISDESPRSRRRVWFRRPFRLDRRDSGQRVELQVHQSTAVEVWINGQSISNDSGAAGVFVADVTHAVLPGDNLIAVRTAVPGIQGSVRIVLHGPLRLNSDGVRLDTPDWQGGPTRLRIRSIVRNDGADDHNVRLTAVVQAPDGTRLTEADSGRLRAPASDARSIELNTPAVSPPLWSPDRPALCLVDVRLHVDGTLVESREVKYGFRWFRFDAERGFFLNGERLQLRGVVYARPGPLRTQDRKRLWDYESDLLKGMGINFVRPSKMIDESFLSVCDRVGLLATVQIPVMESADTIDADISGLVHRLYNHPSIINWHFNGEGKDAEAAALHSVSARTLRRLDPTRPVLCVELGWRAPGSVGLVDTDIAGQGNYTGWYEGTLDHIGPYMDAYRDLLRERYKRPLPIIISNYGAASDFRIHSASPRRNDFSPEYLTLFHERFEREIVSRPWVAGGLVFTFRDLESAQPIPRHTWKGVIDLDENRKDAYYFYQSVWTDRPFVHIAEQDWTSRDVWPPSAASPVQVMSNCEAVELFLNGASKGRQSKSDGFVWLVQFESGANQLRAIGFAADERPEDASSLEIHHRPPVPEVRLALEGPPSDPKTMLTWDAVREVESWHVHRGLSPDFTPEAKNLVGTTSETSYVDKTSTGDAWYRVIAATGDAAGPPFPAVGSAPGNLRWRFPTDGWLVSSPALADLTGDGNLDIVFGSYDGRVYALNHVGEMLWSFDTRDTVLASPAIAELRTGDGLSIVISSCAALHVLEAGGRQRWSYPGIRQFDRNDKSPALGDVDGDGELEIAVGSDTGEMLLLNADGTLRWKYITAGEANRGLSVTTPMFVEDTGGGSASILFSADDGRTRLVAADGTLHWSHDNQLGDTVPGTPANFHHLTPAAGALSPGGPTRIVIGAGHLKVLDVNGQLLWERHDLSGSPMISELSNDGRRQIVLVRRGELSVTDADGSDVWTITLDHPRDYFLQPPVSADIDGDGISELVAGTRATKLYAIDGTGATLWHFATDDEVSGCAAVGDLDRDGRTEIVFGSRDGWLRVLGGGVRTAHSKMSRQYRGGISRRAGCAP